MAQVDPFIRDIRIAATGVRRAVEQVLAGTAIEATCLDCGNRFYFLTQDGLARTEAEACPGCEPKTGSPNGLALAIEDVRRAADDRRGLLAFAESVAESRKCERADAVFFLESLEAGQPHLREMLKLARVATSDPTDAWRAAFLVYQQGLARAATVDRVAGAMAQIQATARPDSILRLVVKAGKKVLYDGPVSARAGTVIREGETAHGRKLRVTIYRNDGTKEHRRGERGESNDFGFDDEALGGVRRMMAEADMAGGSR